MANIKQFGIKGIGSTVQFGKGGNKLISDAGILKATEADGATLAKVKGADGTASDEFVTKSQLDSTFVEFTQYINTSVSYTDGTVNLGNITGNTAVLSVAVTVPSGWTDGTPTITVGDSGDADRFIRATDVDLTDAVQFQSDDMHVYSANTTLTATVSAGGASAGTATILVEMVAESLIPLNYGDVS